MQRRVVLAGLVALLVGVSPVTSLLHNDGRLLRGQSTGDVAGTFFDYADDGDSWGCPADNQSPINISSAAKAPGYGDTLLFRYGIYERPMKMTNTGNTLVAEFEGNIGTISLGIDSYDLWKIVAHTPSEHTWQGKRVPLELQLVHRKSGAAGTGEDPAPEETAVISLGFERSPSASQCDECKCGKCTFLDSLTQGGLPDQAHQETMVNRAAPAALNVFSLLDKSTLWEYTGSSTTPPCGAGVRWFLRTDTLVGSRVNIAKFITAIRAVAPAHQKGTIGNARSLQSAGNRQVKLHKTLGQLLSSPTVAPSDPEFDAAESEAIGEQGSFEKSMKKTAQTQETPQQMQQEGCMKELGLANTNLESRIHHRDAECTALDEAHAEAKEAGAGLSRIAAIKRTTAQTFLCAAEKKTVKRLEAEVALLRKQCGSVVGRLLR